MDPAYRAELIDRFALDLDRPARTYSTGNRQKVALVAAFATRAPLLILDEPASGLDPLMEREFRRAVTEARDRGQAVFLSSHQLDEVEAVCDRVAILRAGRLLEVATVAELRHLHRTAGTGPAGRELSLEEIFLGYYGKPAR
ncbi:AAA family ATPase [Paractinoplanes durhamensis]|uniref:AAA family ATPase n=1 Tax=Paractinoplanes durhamensis TaxID=113563 RepID=UPI00363674CC